MKKQNITRYNIYYGHPKGTFRSREELNIDEEPNGHWVKWEDVETAVNCTYGANINPEKIGDVLKQFSNCIESLRSLILEKTDDLQEKENMMIEIDNYREALNNIKYKD